MDNSDRLTISFFIFTILVLLMLSFFRVNEIENKLDNHHIIQAECEEVITYKQFARPQLLCYMGENHNYSSNERRVIKMWKNGTN